MDDFHPSSEAEAKSSPSATMKLTYSEHARAAYLYLREADDEVVGPVSSEISRPPGSATGDDYFVLDFDRHGRLVGSELLVPDERLLRAFFLA
jgi:uncharacterized protein YuzE